MDWALSAAVSDAWFDWLIDLFVGVFLQMRVSCRFLQLGCHVVQFPAPKNPVKKTLVNLVCFKCNFLKTKMWSHQKSLKQATPFVTANEPIKQSIDELLGSNQLFGDQSLELVHRLCQALNHTLLSRQACFELFNFVIGDFRLILLGDGMSSEPDSGRVRAGRGRRDAVLAGEPRLLRRMVLDLLLLHEARVSPIALEALVAGLAFRAAITPVALPALKNCQ